MVRINEIKLSLDSDESSLRESAAAILRIREKNIKSIQILKKAIDSRKKAQEERT